MHVEIRPATLSDIPALARHRAEMFRDIGRLPDANYGEMVQLSCGYFRRAMASGEYRGWVAVAQDDGDRIAGGAGLQIRPALPSVRARAGVPCLTSSESGLIVNVYTERPYRRQGIARRLVIRLLEDVQTLGLADLTLHASDEGRPLYESLGFVPTNEMRYGPGPQRHD